LRRKNVSHISNLRNCDANQISHKRQRLFLIHCLVVDLLILHGERNF
jgi:hypothetical protein